MNLIKCLESGNKILLCGNGGSAADSQHFAAELVNAMDKQNSRKAIAALALTTDTSVITSIANDFSFDEIFSRQVEALGNQGDYLVSFTTSGESANVLNAILIAKKIGLSTLTFCGARKEKIKGLSDYVISVPSDHTQHIQEGHIMIYHYVCKAIEDYFSGNEAGLSRF